MLIKLIKTSEKKRVEFFY